MAFEISAEQLEYVKQKDSNKDFTVDTSDRENAVRELSVGAYKNISDEELEKIGKERYGDDFVLKTSPDRGDAMDRFGISGSLPEQLTPQAQTLKRNLINEKHKQTLQRAIPDVPLEDIDTTTGEQDLTMRQILGITPDPNEKFDKLNRFYGEGNVLRFVDDGKPAFLVENEGKQVLFDERGFTIGDIFDESREVIGTGGEIAIQFINPAKKITMIGTGLRTAGARFLTETGFDIQNTFQSPNATFGRDETLESIMQSTRKALYSGTIDAVGTKTFDIGSKLFTKPGIKGTNINYDNAVKGVEEINATLKKAGFKDEDLIELPMPAEFSEDLASASVQYGSRYPNSKVGKQTTRFRDGLKRFEDLLIGNKIGDKELMESLRGSYLRYKQAENKLLSNGNVFVEEALNKHASDVVNNISSKNFSEKVLNQNTRKVLLGIEESTKKNSDAMFDLAKASFPEGTGVPYQVYARGLVNTLKKSNVPLDEQAQIIASFLPPSARKILRQSKELQQVMKRVDVLEEQGLIPYIPREELTLDFQSLLDLKQNYNKVYQTLSGKGDKAILALQDVMKYTDGVMERLARNSGNPEAYTLLNRANKNWKETRLPLMEDKKFNSLLDKSSDGAYKIDSSFVMDDLLNLGDKQMLTRLERLRKLSPNKVAFDDNFKNILKGQIWKKSADGSGYVDIASLKKLLESRQGRSLLEFAYNKKTGLFKDTADDILKDLTKLEKDFKIYGSGIGSSNFKMTADEFLQFMSATNLEARQALLRKIQANVTRLSRQSELSKNKLIQFIDNPSKNIEFDADLMMDALPNMKASEILDALDTLRGVKGGSQVIDDFKSKYTEYIIRQARFRSNTRTSNAFKQDYVSDSQSLLDYIGDPKIAENTKAILGEETFNGLTNLATLLRFSGESLESQAKGGLLDASRLVFRGSPEGSAQGSSFLRFYQAVPFNAVSDKFFGIALQNKTILKLLTERSTDAEAVFTMMLPIMLATNKSSKQIISNLEDPRFYDFVNGAINNYQASGESSDDIAENFKFGTTNKKNKKMTQKIYQDVKLPSELLKEVDTNVRSEEIDALMNLK